MTNNKTASRFFKTTKGHVWVLTFTFNPKDHTVDRGETVSLARFKAVSGIDDFLSHIGASEVKDLKIFKLWCDDAGVEMKGG